MKVLMICTTIIFAVYAAIDFASDVLLKTGSDDHNWDTSLTIFMSIWFFTFGAMLWRAFFKDE